MIKAIIFDLFGVLAGSGFRSYVNHELVAYVQQELKPSYKLGLLSNTSRSTIASKSLGVDVDVLFDAVVLSAETGMSKPDPEMYSLACEQLGIQPNEAIFVDDISYNLEPAKRLGMGTIRYIDFDVFKEELEGMLAGH